MNILSIDTTADICSIALLVSGKQFLFHELRPREHAKILLPEIERKFIEANIKASDLDCIVFGRGPGSFTGIRIATGVAQGLAYAANCPVISISTLHSMAFTASQHGATDIWVALDARMSEVYFCRFSIDKHGLPAAVADEIVIAPEGLPIDFLPTTTFIGNGWLTDYPMNPAFQGQEFSALVEHELPNALDSALLAKRLLANDLVKPLSPEKALPTYLRDNVTWAQKPKVGS